MNRKSIANLKVYRSALALERQIGHHLQSLPDDKFYDWGNDLHRAAAAVSHYLQQAHQDYSYQLKIDSLHNARRSSEECQKLIEESKSGALTPLLPEITAVVKQVWGLIKYLKLKQAERQQLVSLQAADELAVARRK